MHIRVRVQPPISIHALREEGDRHFVKWSDVPKVFQSTPSARRATSKAQAVTDVKIISIHALREEGDAESRRLYQRYVYYFNPRPPRGGRHKAADAAEKEARISIHALREEGDVDGSSVDMYKIKFQSTPSARRATSTTTKSCPSLHYFNPRPPRGGRQWQNPARICLNYFNPRPPRGGRRFVAGNH